MKLKELIEKRIEQEPENETEYIIRLAFQKILEESEDEL